MIGLDTGFFVKILENHKTAVQVWTELIEGDEEAFFFPSPLTFTNGRQIPVCIPTQSMGTRSHGSTVPFCVRSHKFQSRESKRKPFIVFYEKV